MNIFVCYGFYIYNLEFLLQGYFDTFLIICVQGFLIKFYMELDKLFSFVTNSERSSLTSMF